MHTTMWIRATFRDQHQFITCLTVPITLARMLESNQQDLSGKISASKDRAPKLDISKMPKKLYVTSPARIWDLTIRCPFDRMWKRWSWVDTPKPLINLIHLYTYTIDKPNPLAGLLCSDPVSVILINPHETVESPVISIIYHACIWDGCC